MDRMRRAIREDRDRRARFLAGVSHDLRTPLTAIGGYLEAIQDGLADDPETLGRYVGIARDRAELLGSRIAGLIGFARMETDEWRRGFEAVEAGAWLAGLSRRFAEDAGLAGLRFDAELDAAAGVRVLADRALLGRALENLVANAFRFSPPGGRVLLSARAEGGRLLLVVDDEGPGIPPAERELVFEPYHRGAGAREGEGSGLGLHVARSVARGHGGELRILDAPGGGGRLVLELPALLGDGSGAPG
jgi:signal transduction histidine kinase